MPHRQRHDPSKNLVGFVVGDVEYAVAIARVKEITNPLAVVPLPHPPRSVAGVADFRGEVIPVVDLRARFGLPATSATLDTRLVVGQKGTRPVALLVDSAREVLKLEAAQLEPPPRAVVEDAAGFVKAVVRVGTRLVMLIDFDKVIGEEVDHG